MRIDSEERILDSSLLIGFPIGRDHIYASHYEGKRLFYCAVSEEELQRHYASLSAQGRISAETVLSRVDRRIAKATPLYPSAGSRRLAEWLLGCYEQVWELRNRREQDFNDLLIAACAIEHKMPLIGHDRIFQRIEILAPDGFRFYTLLDDLPEHAVRRARSRLHLIDRIPAP